MKHKHHWTSSTKKLVLRFLKHIEAISLYSGALKRSRIQRNRFNMSSGYFTES